MNYCLGDRPGDAVQSGARRSRPALFGYKGSTSVLSSDGGRELLRGMAVTMVFHLRD
jgi:hypothetical protein